MSLTYGTRRALLTPSQHFDYVIRNEADVAAVNALGVHTGLAIATVRGSNLRAQLNLVGSDILCRDTGSGAAPVYRGDEPFFGVGVAMPGETDLWEFTMPMSAGGSKIMGNAGFDTLIMPQVSTMAALRLAAAQTYYVVDWTLTTITLRLKAPAGVDPNTTPGYWYAKRDSGIVITGDRARLINMTTTRNAHQDGSTRIVGTAYLAYGGRAEDGCRHNAYGSPGGTWELYTFLRGRNDLESPGTANGLVFNQATITGETATVINCTFDGGGLVTASGGLNFTGPYSHGSVATQVLATFTVTGSTFIDCAAGPSACAVTCNFSNLTFTRVLQGIGINNVGTVNLSNTMPGSTVDVLFKNEVATGTLVFNSTRNNFKIRDLGGGAAGFYKTELAGTTTNLTIDGDSTDVLGVRAATTNANRQLIRLRNGTLKINNMVIGPAVCNRAENLIVAGFSGGTVTYDTASNDNQWPVGGQGTLNGTAYTTLAAWKAGTGADSTTITMALPTAVLSDDFTGASGNLEARPPWQKLTGGANGALTVSGGSVNVASGTLTAYAMGDLPSSNQCVQYTVTGVNAASGGGPALRVLDINNAFWDRWRTASWEFAQVVSGTVSQADASTTVLPTVNDVVIRCLEEVTDPFLGTVSTRTWQYVNNRLLRGMIAVTAATLTAETTVGAVARSVLQTPQFSNVRYFPTRPAA